jgi:transcriptional regulator with XRE-family HTH domain
MEKRTIGGFMAALRKARGLTQQDVADRLNVSNKTVSKWERGESAPDLALIPVIAEMFGVTCDEILLGERWVNNGGETPTVKRDKQMKRLADSAVHTFRMNCLLASLLYIIGYITLLTVSYAFFKPVLGVGLCLAFLATGYCITEIQRRSALHRLNASAEDGMDEALLNTARTGIWREYVQMLLLFWAIAILSGLFYRVKGGWLMTAVQFGLLAATAVFTYVWQLGYWGLIPLALCASMLAVFPNHYEEGRYHERLLTAIGLRNLAFIVPLSGLLSFFHTIRREDGSVQYHASYTSLGLLLTIVFPAVVLAVYFGIKRNIVRKISPQ